MYHSMYATELLKYTQHIIVNNLEVHESSFSESLLILQIKCADIIILINKLTKS